MRVFAFISYLCFLLLGGGTVSHAATNNVADYISVQHLAQDFGGNVSNKDFGNTIIEDNDTDAEDYHDVDLQKSKKTSLISGNGHWSEESYSSLSGLFAFNYYSKNLPTPQPVCTNSFPIYLKNRVLRI